MLDLEDLASRVRHVTDGIEEDQLEATTPCEVDVSRLLAHVLGLVVAFRDAAYKMTGPTTSAPPDLASGQLASDWRQQLPVVLDELVQAWRDPEAWTGDTKAGGVELPGAAAGAFANSELTLHGWDLAVATGQPYAPPQANLEAAWELVARTPDDERARAGLFGPVVPVPADAPLLDRVLGGAGRDPRWAPPAG